MRTSLSIASALVLALAACGGGTDKGGDEAAANQAREDGASAAAGAQAMRLTPGQWEMTTEMKAPEMPDMPAGMKVDVPKFTARTCITAEQAAEPGGDVFSGKKDGNCNYKDYSAAGGRIRGTVSCSGGAQGDMTMTMDGRYGGDSFDVTQKMAGKAQGQTMNMEIHVTGKRIGDCPAGKENS